MDLLTRILDAVDPALRAQVEADVRRLRGLVPPLSPGKRWVLAGHRAAGKTTLLPLIAQLAGRAAIDLDEEIESTAGRSIRALFAESPARFRQLEREVFAKTPSSALVAVGGGFLFHHRDALGADEVILVPVTFETYRQRLLRDRDRPRLRPELSVEDELKQLYDEREAVHRTVRALPLASALAALLRPRRHSRVVTLPPGVAPNDFARRAKRGGADLIELRTDLHPDELDVAAAASELPLLVSQRDRRPPKAWLAAAERVDVPVGEAAPEAKQILWSHHADAPLSPAEALALWKRHAPAPGTLIKHVEPLGSLDQSGRLLETQRLLRAEFGEGRVTVLATGALALPFRCVLAARNALDYLALDPSFAAAPGQRLLADAVREGPAPLEGARLGILGSGIAHSRSPRLHRQPFDRIDLPPDAPIADLLRALQPHYRGFAVTSPFKRQAAVAVGAEQEAVNTLVRRADGWAAANTDVEGARAVLQALPEGVVTVLGAGGVAPALRDAARSLGRKLRFLRASDVDRSPLSGAAIWTWPAKWSAPAALRFDGARVAVIAYGPDARIIAREISRRGGAPLRLGPKWLIAQARAQRALWESAT